MKKLLSKNIIKQSIKNNWKLWAIITGMLCFFIVMVTFVTTSNVGHEGGMPSRMDTEMSLISVYGQMFFGMMGIMLMMIYAIAAGNKLVASEVDRGSMSFTLNTPITRRQLILSKAFFYILSLIAMAVLMGLFGTSSSLIAGVEMEYGTLWILVIGFILFSFATSGICFAASCWFNKSGQSLTIGAGFPVAFYMLKTLSPAVKIDGNEFLKYFSLNTLFDTSAILSGSGYIVQFIVLGLIGIALYTVGIIKFLKKDLPL